jgi:serine/threonine protein kinase
MGEEKTVLPPEAPRDLALVPGDTIAGHRIVKLLGRGGMGEVYQAEVIATGERCALKLLPEAFCRDPGAVARFRREAKVMAGLNHPNLVRVVDSGDDDGRLWLRMELIEAGEGGRIMTLADLANAFDGKIQQQELVDILSQVLAGLACAHDRGVIHRDLKPGNILLCEADGRTRVKVTDFGLAKVVGEEWLRSQAEISVRLSMSLGDQRTRADPLDVTRTGALLGTYEYMSPEQKRGAEADARSDLYAVGLMAYRLLTGQPLGLRTPSQLNPSVAQEWDGLVAKALEELPDERYASAAEMRARLVVVGKKIQTSIRKQTSPFPTMAPREAGKVGRTSVPAFGEPEFPPTAMQRRFAAWRTHHPRQAFVLRHWAAWVGLVGTATTCLWVHTNQQPAAEIELHTALWFVVSPSIIAYIMLRRKRRYLWNAAMCVSFILPVLGPWLMLDLLRNGLSPAPASPTQTGTGCLAACVRWGVKSYLAIIVFGMYLLGAVAFTALGGLVFYRGLVTLRGLF